MKTGISKRDKEITLHQLADRERSSSFHRWASTSSATSGSIGNLQGEYLEVFPPKKKVVIGNAASNLLISFNKNK